MRKRWRGGAADVTSSREQKLGNLCVPIISSTSCDQVIFVDQATDVCLFPDAVQIEINRFG
jgi:hypothetical protein